jgi:PurA ssDNA and RNA-binding protein
MFLPFAGRKELESAVCREMDNIIEARELQIERKHFYVEFRENERGRFLRITEEAHGRRNTIIVPSTGIDEFTAAIDEVIESAERQPA